MSQNPTRSNSLDAGQSEEALLFLKQYVERYESACRALARTSAASARQAERVEDPDKVPVPSEGKSGLRAPKVHRWFAQTRDRIVQYYDDGKPLPGIDRLLLVTETFSMVGRSGARTEVHTWFLSQS